MEDESPPENGDTNKKKRKYSKLWICRWTDCTKHAQTKCNSMCKAHFSEFKCRQKNNNELSQSNSDAQNNDNEAHHRGATGRVLSKSQNPCRWTLQSDMPWWSSFFSRPLTYLSTLYVSNYSAIPAIIFVAACGGVTNSVAPEYNSSL